MARLEFGKLTDAWKGEASDFTPLLAEQLDLVGSALGLELAALGSSEVATSGGRRIDIVAQDSSGIEFVVENQYGRADHDHLTRGLAYAVARHARGLIIIAEEHRDEFRAVAQYLNEMAELDAERGIAVWLVEARAIRIENSAWAPLFTAVVEPNAFTASVEQAKQQEAKLPVIPWTAENMAELAGVANPTVVALIDLCSFSPGAWISAGEVYERAGVTPPSGTGQLGGFGVTLRSRFKRTNAPYERRWGPGGQAQYRMVTDLAQTWLESRGDIGVIPPLPAGNVQSVPSTEM